MAEAHTGGRLRRNTVLSVATGRDAAMLAQSNLWVLVSHFGWTEFVHLVETLDAIASASGTTKVPIIKSRLALLATRLFRVPGFPTTNRDEGKPTDAFSRAGYLEPPKLPDFLFKPNSRASTLLPAGMLVSSSSQQQQQQLAAPADDLVVWFNTVMNDAIVPRDARLSIGGMGTEYRRKAFPHLLSTGYFVRHLFPLVPHAVCMAYRTQAAVASTNPTGYRDAVLPRFLELCRRQVSSLFAAETLSSANGDTAPSATFASTVFPFVSMRCAVQALFAEGLSRSLLPGDGIIELVAEPRPLRGRSEAFVRFELECERRGIPYMVVPVPFTVTVEAAIETIQRHISMWTKNRGPKPLRGIRALCVEHCNSIGTPIDPAVVEACRKRIASIQQQIEPILIVDLSFSLGALVWPRDTAPYHFAISALDRLVSCPAGATVISASHRVSSGYRADIAQSSLHSMFSRPALAFAVAYAIEISDIAASRLHCDVLRGRLVEEIRRVWGSQLGDAVAVRVTGAGALIAVELPATLNVSPDEMLAALVRVDCVVTVVPLHPTDAAVVDPQGEQPAPKHVLVCCVAAFHTAAEVQRIAHLTGEYLRPKGAAVAAPPPAVDPEVALEEKRQQALSIQRMSAASMIRSAPPMPQGAPNGLPPPAVERTYLGRVKALLARHAPDMVPGAEATLQRYASREETLLDELVLRLGVEPSPHTLLARVERMFAQYDYTQLPKAKILSERYAGSGAELMTSLIERLGPEPPPMRLPDGEPPQTLSMTDRRTELAVTLLRHFGGTARERDVPILAHHFRGRLNDLKQLLEDLEPLPRVDGTTVAQPTLRALVLATPALRARITGERNNFLNWLWSDLEQGEVVPVAKAPDPSLANAPPPPDPHAALRWRLLRYYERFEPSKVPQIDQLIRDWAGDEDLLLSSLAAKYGPEPAPLAPVMSRKHEMELKGLPTTGVIGAMRSYYAAVKHTDVIDQVLWEKSAAARRLQQPDRDSEFDIL